MPKHYPGGYQILDLGGMDITQTPTLITRKETIEIIKQAYIKGYFDKPVYITNYSCSDQNEINGYPVLLEDNMAGDDLLIHQHFLNGQMDFTIVINTSDASDGEITVYYTEG